MAKTVFFSFKFKTDFFRVQQVMKIDALTGQTLLNSQDWESVKRQGDPAIERWINAQMQGKSAVVVLIGSDTAASRWVRYEIARAWDNYIPLVGVRIHGLEGTNGLTSSRGDDPFARVRLKQGGTVADHVRVFDPVGWDSKAKYADIRNNLSTWVNSAYKRS